MYKRGVVCIGQNIVPFDFGLRLKQLRESKKLSQADAAKRLGVSKNTVYRYENNLQEPTRENLVKLTTVYSTTLDYICGISNKEPFVLYDLTLKQQEILTKILEAFKN